MAEAQNSVSLRARSRKASNCSGVASPCDDGGRLARLPDTHQGHDAGHGKRKDHERHDPGNAVEAGGRWRREYCVAVLLNETLQHKIVTVTALDGGHKLLAHAIGVRAANVIALEEHLVAAAHAHERVAEAIEARIGVARTHGCRDACEKRQAEKRSRCRRMNPVEPRPCG